MTKNTSTCIYIYIYTDINIRIYIYTHTHTKVAITYVYIYIYRISGLWCRVVLCCLMFGLFVCVLCQFFDVVTIFVRLVFFGSRLLCVISNTVFQIRRTKKTETLEIWSQTFCGIWLLVCLVFFGFVGVFVVSCVCVLNFCWLLWFFCACGCGVSWFWLSVCRNFGKNGNCQRLRKFRKSRKFWETELVEVLLGRASFRIHPKAILVMDYT